MLPQRGYKVKHGLYVPNFGIFSDARLMSELAREAEVAGWDGFFVWDHMFWFGGGAAPVADTYILLAAMASTTNRITLGPTVSPLPRRKPWHVAREMTTLDHLTGGRMVLGVGLGGDWFHDYSAFGDPTDPAVHAEMLDESLEVLARIWSGEKFSYEGKHYTVNQARFVPTPVQRPRIPVWVGGMWPSKRPFRRAARWDGVFPLARDSDGGLSLPELRDCLAYTIDHRESNAPLDVVYSGSTLGGDRAAHLDRLASLAEAGVTWWLEGFDWNNPVEEIRERLAAGPLVLHDTGDK